MTINRDFAENLRAGGDLSGSFDVTGDLATFDNLTVNTAATVPYDNSVSGLTAANIQSAITELNTLVGGGNVGSQATWNVYEFTTAGNDTQFDISTQGSPAPSYVPGYVKVYLNGLLLSESDYTAVDGSTVNFSPAIVDAGQIVSIVVLDSFNTAELLRVFSIDASASTNSLVLDSSSNFGVGTSTLYNAKLQINTATTDTAGTGLLGFAAATGGPLWNWRMGTGDSDLILDRFFGSWQSSPVLAFDRSTGNIGIGDDSPPKALTIKKTGPGAEIQLERSNTNTTGTVGSIGFAGINGTVAGIDVIADGNNDGGELRFFTTTANPQTNVYDLPERMRIDSSGNVGIGADSPNRVLHVEGTVSTFGDTRSVLQISDDTAMAAGVGGGLLFTGKAITGQGDSNTVFAGIHGEKENATSTNTAGAMVFSTRTSGSNPAERMRIDSDGNVGIGTESDTLNSKLVVKGGVNNISAYSTITTDQPGLFIANNSAFNTSTNTLYAKIYGSGISANAFGVTLGDYAVVASDGTDNNGLLIGSFNNAPTIFGTNNTEAMRIDASGNLLVGKTSTGAATAGIELNGVNDLLRIARDGGVLQELNRIGTGGTENGDLIEFRVNNVAVGSIGSNSSSLFIVDDDTGLLFNRASNNILPYRNDSGNEGISDDAIDLGRATGRFKDLYLSGGVVFGDAGGSGTATSNSLDSYEEGTFTPTLTDTASGITPTYVSEFRSGNYTKVGNVVNFILEIRTSTVSGGSTAELRITGLPFSRKTSTEPSFAVSMYNIAFNTDYLYVAEIVTDQLYLRASRNNNTSENMPSSAWSSNNPTLIRITGTYQTT